MKTVGMLEMDEKIRVEPAAGRTANPQAFLTERARTGRASNIAHASKRLYLTNKANSLPLRSAVPDPAVSSGRIVFEWLPTNEARSADISDVAVLDADFGSTADVLSTTDLGKSFLNRPRQPTTTSPRWSNIFSTIERWASLEADWDGNDAEPLDGELLKAVRRFARECEHRRIREPRPYVASDGEVGFHWDAERRAAVSFLPEGRFLAYVDRSSGVPIRISGPLDLATASGAMFEALAVLS